MLKTIVFSFKEDTDASNRTRVLEIIKNIEGVVVVSPLSPASTNMRIIRHCFAKVDSDAVLPQIQSIPEIESAQEPPMRALSNVNTKLDE